jgi:AcrR family transcriptional regulator
LPPKRAARTDAGLQRGTQTNGTDETILAEAAALFATIGFAAASTRTIARACGRSQSVLFHHYPSKDAIFAAVAERAMQGLLAAVNPVLESDRSPGDRLRETVRCNVLEILSDPPYLRSVLVHENQAFQNRFPAWDEQMARHQQAIMDLVREGQRSGEFVADDPEFVYLVIASIVNTTSNWYRALERPFERRVANAMSLDSETVAERIADYALRLVANPRRPAKRATRASR